MKFKREYMYIEMFLIGLINQTYNWINEWEYNDKTFKFDKKTRAFYYKISVYNIFQFQCVTTKQPQHYALPANMQKNTVNNVKIKT